MVSVMGCTAAGVSELTPRERQVLALIAEGYSNSAITGLLFIAEGTLERHIAHILRKLGVAGLQGVNPRVLATLMWLDCVTQDTLAQVTPSAA
jgi:DNA-binding NarL/FixJ family response regulator